MRNTAKQHVCSHVLILLDADGIALFAPDEEKLQRILNTVHA